MKVYLSIQDVIKDIKDKELKEELEYQLDKLLKEHEIEIDKLEERIEFLQEEYESISNELYTLD